MRFGRNQLARLHRRHLVHAHHDRDIRPVDIRVQQADLGAGLGQGQGQIDADGALADAPFATGHSDDIFDRQPQLLLDARV